MGNNLTHNPAGDDWPVEEVSWNDCQEFIAKVNAVGKYHVSLPTEAQWEDACRAGTETSFNFGSTLNGDKANCDGNYHPYGKSSKGPSIGHTTRVGRYEPNAWNIYDMHGNVWEWCEDCYDNDFYTKEVAKVDPCCSSGGYRVNRGGSCGDYARNCRSASRDRNGPGFRGCDGGFRLVCSAGPCE